MIPNSDNALSAGDTTNSIDTPVNSGDIPEGRSSATETTILSNDENDEGDSDEGDADSDEGDAELEVGVIGRLLDCRAKKCDCKGAKKHKCVYLVRDEDGEEKYFCKAKVPKNYLDKWLKTGWLVVSVVDQKPLEDAMKEDICGCGQAGCSDYCIYEVRGWYRDKLMNEWPPESHLVENEPGMKALQKWKQEAARNGARRFYR